MRRSRRGWSRRWSAGVLVALTAVTTTASTMAIWARETLYDTDRFMEVVEPALTDPGFSAGLSTYVSDSALEALDLDARVAESLDRVDAYLTDALVAALDPDPSVLERLRAFERPTLGALSPSISAALEARVVATVDQVIDSAEFRARLPGLVRAAHAGGLALATDDLDELPNVYLEDGAVRVDLLPVVTDALREVTAELREFLPDDLDLPAIVTDQAAATRDQVRAELETSLQTELPDDFGQLQLMDQGTLVQVQRTVRLTDRLVWGTLLLAIALFAAALAVSPQRRRTLIQLSLGVVAGLLVGMLLLGQIQDWVLDRITDPDGLQAVRSLFGALTRSLRTVTVLVAVAASVVAIVAYLAGRPRPPGDRGASGPTAPTFSGRELDRWLADHADALQVAGIVAALGAVLLLLGVEPVALLVVAGLLGLYLWAITTARRRGDAAGTPRDPDQAMPDPPSRDRGT